MNHFIAQEKATIPGNSISELIFDVGRHFPDDLIENLKFLPKIYPIGFKDYVFIKIIYFIKYG